MLASHWPPWYVGHGVLAGGSWRRGPLLLGAPLHGGAGGIRHGCSCVGWAGRGVSRWAGSPKEWARGLLCRGRTSEAGQHRDASSEAPHGEQHASLNTAQARLRISNYGPDSQAASAGKNAREKQRKDGPQVSTERCREVRGTSSEVEAKVHRGIAALAPSRHASNG